jgi:hypothetical protein
MQRLHELDVTGYLLEREPGIWMHVCIPLVAEQDETWNFPISVRVFVRKAGEVLMPERFPQALVNELRSRPSIFAANIEQRPVPLEGNMVRRNEIRFYGGIDPSTGIADERLPQNFDFKLISVDCSFKESPTSDFVRSGHRCTVWGVSRCTNFRGGWRFDRITYGGRRGNSRYLR